MSYASINCHIYEIDRGSHWQAERQQLGEMAHEEALLSHDDGGEAGLVADGGGRQHSFATFGSGMSGSHRHTVGGRRSLTSASMIDAHLRPDSRDPPNTETESVVKVEDGVELDVNIDNWHIWRCVFILHLFYIHFLHP